MNIDNTLLLNYLPLITILASGIFSLLVTISSLFISNKLSLKSDNQKFKKDRDDRIINLYVDIIYQISALIQEIDYKKEIRDLSRLDKIHHIMAQLRIFSSKKIISRINDVIMKYNEYIDVHFSNKPTEIGDRVIISSNDNPDYEKEDELWKEMNERISELENCIKDEMRKNKLL